MDGPGLRWTGRDSDGRAGTRMDGPVIGWTGRDSDRRAGTRMDGPGLGWTGWASGRGLKRASESATLTEESQMGPVDLNAGFRDRDTE